MGRGEVGGTEEGEMGEVRGGERGGGGTEEGEMGEVRGGERGGGRDRGQRGRGEMER